MNPIYKFSLIVGETEKQVFPNYKDDISKDYKLESNQRFYRAELSGKMTFQKSDFDYINGQPFETEFVFVIYKSNDNGVTWLEYWRGKFTKTDCKFDEDNKTCEVQPDLLDEYVDVLAGLEKEYNLIKLAPEITPMLIQRRPLIQIYMPGDSVVSCFLGGDYWEQDANTITDINALVNTYHFALCNKLREVNITVNGTPTAANGLYVGGLNKTTGYGTLYPDTNNGYRLEFNSYETNYNRWNNYTTYYIGDIVIWDNGSGTNWLWECIETNKGNEPVYGQYWHVYSQTLSQCRLIRTSDNAVMFSSLIPGDENADFTLSPGSGTGTATAEMATYNAYARYLLDVDTIHGLTTYNIPADDIVENNRNYKKSIGYAIDVNYISNSFSTEPTEYGLADNGKYFTPPYSIYRQKFFPIARSTWRYASIWFGFYFMDEYFETEGRKTYQIRDNYPLSSVISVLLNEFAPGITHKPTADYSQFLYGTNNPITYGQFRLFITQKTNVTAGDNDRPAQKAPITLNDVFKMLRDCFRCYWYIEDGKLKIEHIEFFRNGGSYSGGQQIGIDLTTAENIRNGKKWGFNTSQYDFDKIDLAERYQFEWMDDATQAFEGFPIEVLSKYVTAGKIENVSISNFTSDIDYMILNPGAISEDGFALFAAVVADALFDTDAGSYLGGGSATSGGYGDKKYRLKTLLNGKVGNLIGSLYSNSGATIQIVFWDSSNNVINTQAQQTIGSGTTSLNANVTIPANAFYVGFKSVSGAFSYLTYYLNIPGSWQLPFINRTVDGTDFSIQNGLVSFLYLIPNFYVYDLPATRVKINEQEIYATGIERKKKQTVNFPTIDDPDPIKLIKTALGSGWVEKISVNLHSRMNKIDLRYDTE